MQTGRYQLQAELIDHYSIEQEFIVSDQQNQQKNFVFSKEEITDFTESSASYLYIYDSEHKDTWLEFANPKQKNADLNQKTLVIHIKNQDWPAIISMYDRLSTKEKSESIYNMKCHCKYPPNCLEQQIKVQAGCAKITKTHLWLWICANLFLSLSNIHQNFTHFIYI